MVEWSQFITELSPTVRGCPQPLMETALRNKAIDFFQKTRAWCQWLDPTTTIAGVRDYDFDTPARTDVIRVEKATLDGAPIGVASYRQYTQDIQTTAQTTNALVAPDMKTFTLAVSPADGQIVKIMVSLVPSATAIGIDDSMYPQYRFNLLDGARSELLMMTNVPWSDLKLGSIYEARFNQAVNDAVIDTWKGGTSVRPRTVASFF